ncbi:MAG: hypothetical protein IJ562_09245 [Prevotella sp.]|nr:hypothetical protein [Prevotella sp.]
MKKTYIIPHTEIFIVKSEGNLLYLNSYGDGKDEVKDRGQDYGTIFINVDEDGTNTPDAKRGLWDDDEDDW